MKLTTRSSLPAAAVLISSLFCCAGCVSKPPPPVATEAAYPESNNPAVARLRGLLRQSHVAFLEECLAHCRANYNDYRCMFTRQERLDGLVRNEQEIGVKFRERPFSLAMAWVKNAPLADRMLYVEGRHDGMILVRPSGGIAQLFAGKVVRKDPNSEEVRRQSLRRLSEFGFQRGLQSIIAVYHLAAQRRELREETLPDANVLGRRTFVLVRHLPDRPEYPAAKSTIYIDQEWLTPILIEGADAKGDFICRYLYKDVQFNAGLTDEDFLPENNDLAPAPAAPGKG
jgi:hypothetical protein